MSVPAAERVSQEPVAPAAPAPMNWRERALAALASREKQMTIDAAMQAQIDTAKLAQALTRLFGQDVHAPRMPIEVDGLRFVAGYDAGEFGRLTPRLLGVCPKCGGEAASPLIHDLYQVGQFVRRFVVGAGHHCPEQASPQQPTTEERLLAVLRDLIDERLDHELSTRGQS